MKSTIAIVGLCTLIPFASVGAASSTEHFAQRFALQLDGNAPYYTVTLPGAVYQASRRDDLGDLRIFNGAGEPVPYSLQAPRTPTATPPALQAVKWFPLPLSDAGIQGAPAGVTIAPDGTLRVTRSEPARTTRDADLVDIGKVSGRVGALVIHLRDDNYQGRVSVVASDDLRNWQSLTDAPLLKVNYAGNSVVQERIPLDDLHARYVRLHWLDRAPDIASIDVEVHPDHPDPSTTTRQWREGIVARTDRTPGEYIFETDGAYPVDRLRLSLPQPNTVVRATVYSRADANTPWREAASGVLFRLRGSAGEQSNPPLEFVPDTDHLWRVDVDMRNGGLGSGTLTASVGWRPASLTFVARGAPPFTLAVGNASLGAAALSRDELLVGAASDVVTARVGDALPVSPQEKRAAGRDTDSARRYVLWAALLAAVGVLAGMAWRLMRRSEH
jgi:Protein of unknown function (DUF3999)